MASLLVASITAGFIGAVFQEQLHIATAVTTRYSTWTSTSYSEWYGTSYSTAYAWTTTISEAIFKQEEMEGEYVRITGTWRVEGYSLVVNLYITNLMRITIERAVLLMSALTVGGPEPFQLTVQTIKPGETYNLYKYVTLEYQYGKTIIKGYFEGIMIYCGKQTMTTYIPIVTYTFRGTKTETYLGTYTTAYTTMTETESYIGPALLFFVLIAGGIVLAFVAFLTQRRKVSPPSNRVHPIASPAIRPAATAKMKHCPECGLPLPLVAKHCPKCGTQQYYYGEP